MTIQSRHPRGEEHCCPQGFSQPLPTIQGEIPRMGGESKIKWGVAGAGEGVGGAGVGRGRGKGWGVAGSEKGVWGGFLGRC